MKSRQRYIIIWCTHHRYSITILAFVFVHLLATGMSRRNSDALFNHMRNSGLLFGGGGGGGGSREGEDEQNSLSSPLRRNYLNSNNYYNTNTTTTTNTNNSNSNRRQQQQQQQLRTETNAMFSSSNGNAMSKNKNAIMRLTDNNDSNNNRNLNLISTSSSSSSSNSNNINNNNNNNNKKSYLPRQASVNSILRLNPSKSLWDESSVICHTVPGLTREQMELCLKAPDVTAVAIQGIQLATDECAYQMQKHRWNCSSLQGTINPHNTQLLQKGYRESAFGHSIAAAGVSYAVAKACSQGKLLNCGCGFQYDDQVNYFPSKTSDYAFDDVNEAVLRRSGATAWKWAGCSHNMNYGIKFAKTFLDAREKSSDLPSRTNLHNNRVGRLAVAENMEIRCKCHGLSGSCELRTCWRSAPDFRKVGTELKNKFRRAIMIDRSNFGNRPLNRLEYHNGGGGGGLNLRKLDQQQQQRRKRDRGFKKLNKRNSNDRAGLLNNIDLWYYEKSPTYCESNQDFNIPGTSGRRCNRTSLSSVAGGGGKDAGSCNTLCCGRGYNTIRQVYTTRCNCQFLWCCQVTCQNCTIDEWITVCK